MDARMNDLEDRALRDAVAYADQWLEYRREFRDIPGLVVAVRHGKDLLLSKAYGWASLEDDVAMMPQHIFRIASHSKTFTATAIMQLVEQGRLRLDDRASTYLTWLPSEVTIRQLLSHTGGLIRDGRDADFWHVEREFPDRNELRAVAADGMVFETNRSFKYSNIGFGLLGLVIEAVTGTDYNKHVTRHVVERLGLVDTGPEVDPGRADRMVSGYTRARLGVARQAVSPTIDTHALSPATGFFSTAEDLCEYASAHCTGDDRLLSDASKREMQHPWWQIDQADEGYGLGFSVRSIGRRQMIGHGGGFPGQSTRTLIDPAYGLVVVVFSNTSASDGLAAPLAESIVKLIDFALACSHVSIPDLPLDRFTGRFASSWGVTDIVAFGGALRAIGPEADDPVQRVSELQVIDADTLRIAASGGYASPGETVRYERDGDERITRVVLGGTTNYPVDLFRQRYGSTLVDSLNAAT
jgi:CubicO group peptidase (beta-lactamase class C family)